MVPDFHAEPAPILTDAVEHFLILMRKIFRILITCLVVLKAITIPLYAHVQADWKKALDDLGANKNSAPLVSEFARARRLERKKWCRQLSLENKLAKFKPDLASATPPAAALELLLLSREWREGISSVSVVQAAGTTYKAEPLSVQTPPYSLSNTVPNVKLKALKLQATTDCALQVKAADFDNGSRDADGDELTFTFFEDGEQERSFPVGTHVVEIEVSDGSNFVRATAQLKVEDKALPTAVAKNITVELSASGVATITAAQVDNGSSDACSEVFLSLSKARFNCAELGENTVTLLVNDGNGNSATAEAIVTVVDAIAPTVPATYSFSVNENTAAGFSLGSIQGADNCGALSYLIKSGNVNGAFSINSNSGEIKVANAAVLDYESITEFTLSIEVSDNSNNSATSAVVIALNNLNDHLPQAGVNITAAQQIREDEAYSFTLPAGAFTDADVDDALSYSAPGLPAWLSFNQQTLTLSGTPLNEHVGIHRIKIKASDKAGQFAEQAFELLVINTNDAPHGILLSNNSLEENEPAGTTVGTLSTLDVDAGDTHTYSLAAGAGDADNASFAITANTLSILRPLNYEEKEHYSLRVRTTDAAGATYEEVLTVSVTDLPDSEPFLPNLFSPNGDGSNDFFIVRAYNLEQLHLRIFNKKGQLVYETTNIAEATQKGWDGTTNGKPQPEGTYVWQLSGRYRDGKPLAIEGKNLGSVSLIR